MLSWRRVVCTSKLYAHQSVNISPKYPDLRPTNQDRFRKPGSTYRNFRVLSPPEMKQFLRSIVSKPKVVACDVESCVVRKMSSRHVVGETSSFDSAGSRFSRQKHITRGVIPCSTTTTVQHRAWISEKYMSVLSVGTKWHKISTRFTTRPDKHDILAMTSTHQVDGHLACISKLHVLINKLHRPKRSVSMMRGLSFWPRRARDSSGGGRGGRKFEVAIH